MPGADMSIRSFLWRAERVFPDKEIAFQRETGVDRYTYAEYGDRVAKLANALSAAGVDLGDRVGTLCANHHRHFEAYFAIPNIGAQLHTINPQLPTKHLEYVINDAADSLLFVDPVFCDKIEPIAQSDGFETVEQYVVMGDEVPETALEPVIDYESFVRNHDADFEWPVLDDEQPAGLCYTSGTTGKPKGVEYTQKMTWAHIMANLTQQGHNIKESDVVLNVVPMAHINSWCIPYEAAAAGAEQVYPGHSPGPDTIVRLIEEEDVTYSAGVPTVWRQVLEHVRETDVSLESLEELLVGGSPPSESLIRGYEEYGVEIRQGWGMTEMTGVGAVSTLKSEMAEWDAEDRYSKLQKQGLITPGLEFKVVDDDGNEVSWGSESIGEIYVRGPWVSTEYFGDVDRSESHEGDWLKTGDIVTIDDDGYINIVDRTDDLIKSGGEWISSVELENTIMDHEIVQEASVIGVPDEEWHERPVAFIVPNTDVSESQLQDIVSEAVVTEYPKWWTPDEVIIVTEIPKTSTGKFDKKQLRDEY